MKLVLTKGTMIVAAGVTAVAVGGGAYAATSSSPKTALRSDSHALPAPGAAVAKVAAAPKRAVAKAKGPVKAVALPKAPGVKAPALPAPPPVAGLTCPAAPSVSGLRGVLSARWGLTLTAQTTGSVRITGHAYCQISQTWTNPLGKVLDLRTVSVPTGLALPAVARALGSTDGVPLSLAGAQAWQTPVGAGAGILWLQRSGVVIVMSGDSLLPGVPMRPLAEVVRRAG